MKQASTNRKNAGFPGLSEINEEVRVSPPLNSMVHPRFEGFHFVLLGFPFLISCLGEKQPRNDGCVWLGESEPCR